MDEREVVMSGAENHAVIAQIRRIYRFYQDLISPLRFMIRRFIRSHEGRLRASRCLDIGSGTNPYERQLRRAFSVRHYISADLAPSDRTLLITDAQCLSLANSALELV